MRKLPKRLARKCSRAVAAGFLVLVGCQADEEMASEQPPPVVVPVAPAAPAPAAAPSSAPPGPVAVAPSVPEPAAAPAVSAPPVAPKSSPTPEPPAPARPAREAEPPPEPAAAKPAPTQETASPASKAGAGDLAAGKKLFTQFGCAGCHGPNGSGGLGPALNDSDWVYGGDDASIFKSIHDGRPGGMPGWGTQLSDAQIRNLVGYVQSLGRS